MCQQHDEKARGRELWALDGWLGGLTDQSGLFFFRFLLRHCWETWLDLYSVLFP